MKTAICSMIKDEHLYLKEWIDWHLNLGFDAIHLFEDKGSKSHEDIVKDYDNVYLRKYEDIEELREYMSITWADIRLQKLFQWFGDNNKDVYDWILFIDIDEFVKFHNGYDLEKLCNEFEPYSGVLLNWRMMGASGHIKRPNCGVLEAYTEVVDFSIADWYYKSLCNMKNWKGMENLHKTFEVVNTNHNSNINEICWDKVSLDHYFTKSWEDWVWRVFKRGCVVNGHRKINDFFVMNKDMEPLRVKLLNSISDIKPKGTYYIDDKTKLIYGGNIKKIQELNKKNKK